MTCEPIQRFKPVNRRTSDGHICGMKMGITGQQTKRWHPVKGRDFVRNTRRSQVGVFIVIEPNHPGQRAAQVT